MKETIRNTPELINEFLSLKRFSMIGVSRNPKDFSRMLFNEFIQRGFDVVPINPNTELIDGRRCFSAISQVTPPLTSALLMMSGKNTLHVLNDCIDAGVALVWLYGIRGIKDVDLAAVELCEEHGIKVIAGYCPFMFLYQSAWYHRLHGWAWKMIGYYPKS